MNRSSRAEPVVMWRPRPSTVMTASSILLAFAPKCPICFLAYFGVFGVAASSASAYRLWIAPVTAVWLALTVGLLAVGRGSRRLGPVVLGLAASITIFAGRFNFENRFIVIAGLAGLVTATLWRTWTRTHNANCDRCEPTTMRETTISQAKIISTQSLRSG